MSGSNGLCTIQSVTDIWHRGYFSVNWVRHCNQSPNIVCDYVYCWPLLDRGSFSAAKMLNTLDSSLFDQPEYPYRTYLS